MIRLGIVGCGKVTTMFHLKAIEEVDEVTVAAVADLDKARMEDVRRKSGAKRGYMDPKELLSDPSVEVVAVNTPPRFHEETAIEALRAGKHVLCEKPLAQSVEGCARIKEAQGGSGLVVLPVHNYAFTPCLETARGIVVSGEIGKIQRIGLRFDNNLWSYGPKTDFRMKDEFSIVEDLLPHVLSVVQAFTGPVRGVEEARGWRRSHDVMDDLSLVLTTEDGVRVEGSMNWTSLIPAFKASVEGESGRLEMDLMKFPYRVYVESPEGKRKLDERGLVQYLDLIRLRHPAFVGQYRHLVGAVAGSEAPRFTVDDEMGMLKVMGEVVEIMSETDIS
jgi:predicted dehydrogenase